MDTPEHKRLSICLLRYENCLVDEYDEADILVKTLCLEKGLWSQFCRGVIKNHGRVLREQIRINLLRFLACQAQIAIKLCRRGTNRLHQIRSCLDAGKIFISIFCGPSPNLSWVGRAIPQETLDQSLRMVHKILDIDGDELHELVLKFGKYYLGNCRMERFENLDDLVTLGADYELSIEQIGSNTAEVQKWLVQKEIRHTNTAYRELMKLPMHAIMSNPVAVEQLRKVAECLEPEEHSFMEGGPWFIRNKPITAHDLRLEPEDIEYIRRLQRELDIQDSL